MDSWVLKRKLYALIFRKNVIIIHCDINCFLKWTEIGQKNCFDLWPPKFHMGRKLLLRQATTDETYCIVYTQFGHFRQYGTFISLYFVSVCVSISNLGSLKNGCFFTLMMTMIHLHILHTKKNPCSPVVSHLYISTCTVIERCRRIFSCEMAIGNFQMHLQI